MLVMKMRNLLSVGLVASVFGTGSAMLYQKFLAPAPVAVVQQMPARLAAHSVVATTQPIDFRYAASSATSSVVHVKSTYKPQAAPGARGRNPLQDFFGDDFFQFFHGPNPYRAEPQTSTGSGVIVTSNGFIVTNNHVVDNASEIEVTLNNNKSFKAKMVGRDPDTDLAVLKIEEENLPAIPFANSDSALVGEWVLAVGNPFNLSSTVTAGIISAKGRSLNLLGDAKGGKGSNSAVESFIQTDAAVNPGNSGGALVNVHGELVGINTAIASPTGSYAGYSFAVPSNIVKKVIVDLKEFGITQRGFLGVVIRPVDESTAKEVGLDRPAGVYVQDVNKGSASADAGLKSKDVILSINGIAVNSTSELQEQVAQHRPGDKLRLEYFRSGKVETAVITLKNKYNSASLVSNERDILGLLGVAVSDLSPKDKQILGLSGGVKITGLKSGKFSESTDIKEGFVITQIDDQPINNSEDFVNIMKNKEGKVVLEGLYPGKPYSYLYALKM
jgi:Do/DeqQ family serine protease